MKPKAYMCTADFDGDEVSGDVHAVVMVGTCPRADIWREITPGQTRFLIGRRTQ